MARPMLLIKQTTLHEIWHKSKQEVPVAALLRQYELSMTRPTLAKLIAYYDAYQQCLDDSVGDMIKASLFPEWLEDGEGLAKFLCAHTVLQPPDWVYHGTMPLGEWKQDLTWSEK